MHGVVAVAGSGGTTMAVPAAVGVIVARAESLAALHATRAEVWYNLGDLGLGFISPGIGLSVRCTPAITISYSPSASGASRR